MGNDFKKRVWKFILVLNWVVIFAFWWSGSGQGVFNGVSSLSRKTIILSEPETTKNLLYLVR
jgi:hypothetical protein